MAFTPDPICRAAVSACFVVPVAWVVCCAFRELPRRIHCWIWRLAYAKILVSTLAIPPIAIPLIPHSMAETRSARGQFELTASLESRNKEVEDTAAIDRSTIVVDRLARDGGTSILQITKSFLVPLWFAIFGFLLIRSVREWFRSREVRRRAEACNDEEVCCTYSLVSKQMRARTKPPLLLSNDVSTAALVGLLAPAVVVPHNILSQLSKSQIHSVISHELAHFVRRDLVWSLLPRLAHCVLFFHPLIWFAGRRWRLAQESACDALVLENQRLDVADYAEALITTTQLRSQSGKSIPCMGVAATSSFRDLKERLTAMQVAKSQSRHVIGLVLGLVFVLGVVGIVPWKLVAVRGAEDPHRKSDIECRDAKTNHSPLSAAVARGRHPSSRSGNTSGNQPIQPRHQSTASNKGADSVPHKFKRPEDPADALYHDVLCGDIERVEKAIRETPELVKGKRVIEGAWSHGGRRCGAQDDVITCIQLIADNGADFSLVGPGTFDSAFKAFPRAAALLFELGADPKKTDSDGSTGLHVMAKMGNRFGCEILLKHGAEINAKNEAGKTPLDVALEHNLPRLCRFLLERGAETGISTREPDLQPIERSVEVAPGRLGGEVTWYRADRGYGYIRDEIRGELFFDREEIFGDEPESIEAGTVVSFEVAHDKFGMRATKVDFGKVEES